MWGYGDRADDGRSEERDDFVQQSKEADSSGGTSYAPGLSDGSHSSTYDMDPASPSMLTMEQFSRHVEGPPRPLLLRVLRRLATAVVFAAVLLLGLFCVCAPIVCCALAVLCLCLTPLGLATFGITWVAQGQS